MDRLERLVMPTRVVLQVALHVQDDASKVDGPRSPGYLEGRGGRIEPFVDRDRVRWRPARAAQAGGCLQGHQPRSIFGHVRQAQAFFDHLVQLGRVLAHGEAAPSQRQQAAHPDADASPLVVRQSGQSGGRASLSVQLERGDAGQPELVVLSERCEGPGVLDLRRRDPTCGLM